MRTVLRFLLALSLFAFGSLASAAFPTAPQWGGVTITGTYGSLAAACEAFRVQKGLTAVIVFTDPGNSGRCYRNLNGTAVEPSATVQLSGAYCPANSTPSGGQCQCNAQFEENSSHNACVPKKTENETQCSLMGAGGFTRGQTGKTAGSVPNQACFLTDPPFPGEEGKGCLMDNMDAVMVPNSDGTRSFSATGKYTGAACTPAADPVLGDPKATKEDKCPGGFEGTVNGVSKCIASEPDKGIEGVKTTTKNNADGSTTQIKEETKCTGAMCTTTRTETNTPAGGGTPTTQVSGTTQTLADKCATDKTNPVCTKTGTTPPTQGGSSGNGDDEDGMECGIEGKPACKVKVDEQGTPTGQDAISQDGLNAAMDKAEEGIAKAIDKTNMDTSWGGVPQWFNSGSCTPWQLGTLPIINKQITLNICVIQPYVIGVMTFLWVVGTFFAIIGMVGRVVGAGVK